MANIPNFSKRTKQLDEIQSKMGKARLKNMCECLHTRHGEPNIVSSKKRTESGQLLYLCRSCHKDLTLNKVPEHSHVGNDGKKIVVGYREAVSTLDSMCDVIKMSLDVQKSKELNIAKKIAEFQYQLNQSIIPAYQASLKKESGGEKGNRNKNESSSWNKPQTY